MNIHSRIVNISLEKMSSFFLDAFEKGFTPQRHSGSDNLFELGILFKFL